MEEKTIFFVMNSRSCNGVGWIDDIIVNNGVRYMYSDSEVINSNPEFKKFIADTLLIKGSISVFKLKIPTTNITEEK